ncbi:hypothetical protein [Sandarakinorhabdus sp. DWP1-3-1]
MYDIGDYSINDLSDLFEVPRPTICRALAPQPAVATLATGKPDASN